MKENTVAGARLDCESPRGAELVKLLEDAVVNGWNATKDTIARDYPLNLAIGVLCPSLGKKED